MKRFLISLIFFGICIVGLTQILGAKPMSEVQFDIGKNIVDAARASGAQGYSTQNIDGLLMYDANLTPDVPVRYARPGYEIVVSPIFSLTLYADRKSNNNLAVQTASLQTSTRTIRSHAAARDFVDKLVLQFKNGKWLRYIDDLCPAVTGRSTLLNEAGHVEQIEACALDPDYKLSDEEWAFLMQLTQNYEWVGDGVLAKLTVGFHDFGRGLEYAIDLEFDDLSLKEKRDKENLSQELSAGDAKGWRSTENHLKNMAEIKARRGILEKNAVKRGDALVVRR
jgi:hypothetical protein